VAVNNTYTVASEADMLALSANVGDIAIRTDTKTTYILSQTPATDLANWMELLSHQVDITPITLGGTGRTDGKVTQVAVQVAPGNIDTLYATGVYQINGYKPTGYPADESQSYAMLEVQNSANNDTANSFAFQKLTVVGGHVWLRQRSGNPVVWGSWARIDETSDVIDNNTDLNTITSSGRYHAGGTTGLTNNPAGVNGWFTLVVDALNANNGSQT
ncbi:pyocin knob domain-containing protein, partial [Herbiconiux daphne]